MYRTLILTTLLTLLALNLPTRAANDIQIQASLRSISTTGEAVVYVTPNEVTVNLGVETYNADLSEATTANDKSAATLVKAVKALGIEEKYIGTDDLQVIIHYDNERGGQRHSIDGYQVIRNYAIKLTDTKLFDKLVTTALKSGANRMDGVSFQTTELRKYRDQARQMAARAAKEKAVAMAKELDSTVGKPRTITEGSNNMYFGRYNWNGGNSFNNSAQSVAQEGAGGAADEGGETLPLGQMAVRASISVTFDLAD